jgi:hypothetical protein
MRKLISFGFSVQSRGFLTFKVKLPSSVCSQRSHKHSFSPSHVLKQQFRRHKSSFRGEEEDECVNKMKKELYANMTAEETEKMYEEIYKPGYIDDMLDRNYIPIPFGKLEILNPEAAMLFDMFKDRPLHPADKEQYPIPRELSKCVEAIIVLDYPKQQVIKPLLLKGRILEYLDEKKREAVGPDELSKGKEYYFLQKYAYHILIKFEPFLRPFSREYLPVFVKVFDIQVKLNIVRLALMIGKATNNRSLSDREKKLYDCVFYPAIYERDGVEAYVASGGKTEGVFKKNSEEEESL